MARSPNTENDLELSKNNEAAISWLYDVVFTRQSPKVAIPNKLMSLPPGVRAYVDRNLCLLCYSLINFAVKSDPARAGFVVDAVMLLLLASSDVSERVLGSEDRVFQSGLPDLSSMRQYVVMMVEHIGSGTQMASLLTRIVTADPGNKFYLHVSDASGAYQYRMNVPDALVPFFGALIAICATATHDPNLFNIAAAALLIAVCKKLPGEQVKGSA